MKTTSILSSILVVFCLVQVTLAEHCAKPPVIVKPDECCDMPKIHDEAEIGKCMETYGEQTMRVFGSYSGEGPMRGCCVAECIANVSGHADLNVAKMKAENMEAASGPEWTSVIENAATNCEKLGTARKDELEAGFKLPPLKAGDPVCHPKYAFAMMCVIKEFVGNCPEQHWKPSENCNKIREFTKTCTL